MKIIFEKALSHLETLDSASDEFSELKGICDFYVALLEPQSDAASLEELKARLVSKGWWQE